MSLAGKIINVVTRTVEKHHFGPVMPAAPERGHSKQVIADYWIGLFRR
jgi:hypothetical protein